MADAPPSLSGILDIAPPVAPATLGLQQGLTFGLLFFLGLGILLLAGYLLWRYRLSQRGKARHQLTRLLKCHHRQQISTHSAAFRLAAILRDGLCLAHVSNAVSLPASLQPRQARWREFIERLAVARYAPGEIDADQLAWLFSESQFWLRTWP